MKKGVIYILTNPSFPDYIKIGFATDIEKRLKQLNRSETTPFAFRAYAIYEVESALTDKELHKLIDTLNPDLRSIETFDGKQRVKEFYAMSAEDAYSLLESIAKISGTTKNLKRLTPEGHEIVEEQIAEEVRETRHRGPFTFSACNIPVGATIAFVNDPSITATVVDDRHIEFRGQTTSMSSVAQELLGSKWQVQGTAYFTYKGKKLTDLRAEAEQR